MMLIVVNALPNVDKNKTWKYRTFSFRSTRRQKMRDSTFITIIFIFIYLSWNLYMQQKLASLEMMAAEAEETEALNKFEEAERRLGQILEDEKKQLDYVWEEVSNLTGKNSKVWMESIPIVVFACNRPAAIRDHLEKLIRLRPSQKMFPITVSQDCDDKKVVDEVKKFGNQVEYIKHAPGSSVKMDTKPAHKRMIPYYYISRHYKLALSHIFSEKPYSTVIITEDDLDIAPDFFSYFSNTRYLLEKDPTLYCVSAWNDNGKLEHIDWNANTTLYRSDFFPGLGWMMTRKLWNELVSTWPAGFWDDWMREPAQRKGRQCIRPEISRTGMMAHGKKGVSKGQFFKSHLSKIKVNNRSVDFAHVNLDYLLPENFKKKMELDLGESLVGNITEIISDAWIPEKENMKIKIMYSGNDDFVDMAINLGIMKEFKAGVPRTAYNGIVTCFYKKTRLFLVPSDSGMLTGGLNQ